MNLQKLDFIVGLIDKVSAPAGKMMKTMDTVTSNIQKSYRKIGYGVAGVAGAGFALNRLIAPTKELNKALGEVRSLDVADSVLTKLTATSLKFSMQYGESAADFVSASYDIQSAIGGLVGNELATFTEASAILAKGTKADTATITSYVGTMYGIFKQNADAMGKAEWVQQLAGQTAAAVQMFKTTGAEMSASFGNLGAEATAHGIKMHEQLAILGTLQATMTGTEAGTKYKSFLAGVGNAQDKLGLKFTNSTGQMLPMIEILEKIKGKFGAIDTVAESDMLQKAFGRKEASALIKLLVNDIDGLSSSINQLGAQKGMEKAIKMATAIADPFEKAGAKVQGLQIKLSQAMMPAIHKVLAGFGAVADKLMRWTTLFPNVTKYVGIAVLGIFALIAGLSVLSIVVGIAGLTAAGFGLVLAVLTSPITLIIVGVGALIALIASAVIYWDEWTQVVINFASEFLAMTGVFAVVDTVLAVWDKLPQWWAQFSAWMSTLDPFSIIGDGVDWLINKLNYIPGINIKAGFDAPKAVKPPAAFKPTFEGANAKDGGVINRISNANNANSSKKIGDVIVQNFGTAMDGSTLLNELAFAN